MPGKTTAHSGFRRKRRSVRTRLEENKNILLQRKGGRVFPRERAAHNSYADDELESFIRANAERFPDENGYSE